MLTSCNHCGTQYKLPDKMLGRQGRCKACGKLFVLAPVENEVELAEVELPQPTGSTAQLRPISQQEEAWDDDPLGALAEASGSSPIDEPIRVTPSSASASGSRSPRYDDEEDDRRGPKRMAKGAALSMGTGIASAALAAIGGVFAILAMVNSDDQKFMITMGIVAIGLVAIAGIVAMIAVVNSTSAMRNIRRARHPLSGKSEASTGTITGCIALGLVLIIFVSCGIWLSRRGGIKFEKQVDEQGNEIRATE